MNNMRYFLVVMVLEFDNGIIRTVDVNMKNDKYPSRASLIEYVSIIPGCDSDNMSITNIIELNESDYNDFIK